MLLYRQLKLALFTLGCSVTALPSLSAGAQPAPGQTAAQQIRHLATHFPGRMAGSPAEMMAAEYLNQRFEQMGYQSNTRTFNTRYIYTSRNGSKSWRTLTATSVIAARNGSAPQQIVVTAHFDTYTPLSDDDVDSNLGGLTLQGVDDNASGVGVMLELAERLSHIPTRYGIRFVALSAEEIGSQGARNYLQRMSERERQNTLLVINIDSLIVGDMLYFNSGRNTPAEEVKKSRDRALGIARRYAIPAATNPGDNPLIPPGTGCCSDNRIFDEAGLPVMTVEATNWSLGNRDGYQQRAISLHFPQGTSWHQSALDNLDYLDRHLPGQIEKRSRDSVRILLPLLKELAMAETVGKK